MSTLARPIARRLTDGLGVVSATTPSVIQIGGTSYLLWDLGSGLVTVEQVLPARILLAAAGGSGSEYPGGVSMTHGAGGGGGVIEKDLVLLPGTYMLTVGLGVANSNGGDTIAFALTAIGGGKGSPGNGSNGGSGGGGGGYAGSYPGGASTIAVNVATPPQGYSGAAGVWDQRGGGGGGAGGPASGAAGGPGYTSLITGTALTFGTGGTAGSAAIGIDGLGSGAGSTSGSTSLRGGHGRILLRIPMST